MAPPNARLIVVVLTSSVVLASGALAQRVISAKAGFVFYVQGRVSAASGPLSAGEHFLQLKDGESLSTERGRVEVLLNPGIVLRLGDMSRLRMDDVKLTDACVSLQSGAAVVTVNYILKTDRIRLKAGGSVIVLKGVGVYRFDLGRVGMAQARLRVFSGQAEVRRDGSSAAVTVKRGQAVTLDDGAKIAKFNVKETDALQRWSDARSITPGPRGRGGLRPIPPRPGWQASDPPPQDPSVISASNFPTQF
jgi:hypothetical protein